MDCITRTATSVLVVGLFGVTVPASVSAQAATMTMAPAQASCGTATVTYPGSTYTESGYTLTAAQSFAAWCPTNVGYYAGPNLFIDTPSGTATLMKEGGGVFTLSSIDLAHLYFGLADPYTVTFTGHLFGGSTVSQVFVLPAQTSSTAFATYTFDPAFTNLTSVDFAAQVNPYYQFTNVSLNAVTTPEPASLTLLATGLVGMFGAARRKRGAFQA